MKNEVHKEIEKKADKLRLCKNVKPTLKNLKKKKVKLVLMTNSPRNFVFRILKKNHIEYFDKLFYAENFTIKEKAIKSLAKKYKIKVKDIVYVADKFSDIRIAKRAGCKIIIPLACSWDKENLKKKKYSFIIKDLRQIKK